MQLTGNADLLHGWPTSSARRPALHVNPVPAKKPSQRAKYGLPPKDPDTGPKGPSSVPKPRAARPRKPTSVQFFEGIIQRAREDLEAVGGDATQLRLPPARPRLFAPPADATEAAGHGPHPAISPHMTAKIVARIAACRHWRRPLATRLLPKFLPVFDQHAAAYFFRHVPSLQPQPTGRQPDDELEAGAFQLMVQAVCYALLRKAHTFGPRALTFVVSGLGAMRIRHDPMLTAWEHHSTTQLHLLQPHQLCAALHGLAQLGHTPGGAWQQAAYAAALAAAPSLELPQASQLLQDLAQLRIAPLPQELLDALCEVIRRCADDALRRAGSSIVALAVVSLSARAPEAAPPMQHAPRRRRKRGSGRLRLRSRTIKRARLRAARRASAARLLSPGGDGASGAAAIGTGLAHSLAALGAMQRLPPSDWLAWAVDLAEEMMTAEQAHAGPQAAAFFRPADYARLAQAAAGLQAAGAPAFAPSWLAALVHGAVAACKGSLLSSDGTGDELAAAPAVSAAAGEPGRATGGSGASAELAVVPALGQIVHSLLELGHVPEERSRLDLLDLGRQLAPHMPPADVHLWLRVLRDWGPAQAAPAKVRGSKAAAAAAAAAAALPWAAVVAVTSHHRLHSWPADELLQLPAALQAAGCCMPAAWGAAYVSELAARTSAVARQARSPGGNSHSSGSAAQAPQAGQAAARPKLARAQVAVALEAVRAVVVDMGLVARLAPGALADAEAAAGAQQVQAQVQGPASS